MLVIKWKYEGSEAEHERPFSEVRGANTWFDKLAEDPGVEYVEYYVTVRRFESKYRKKNIEVRKESG
jgi:hypothetical protein